MSKIAWKAYEEVHFSDQYILRWVREGDEYANRITKEMMEDLKSVVRQQQTEIEALKKKLEPWSIWLDDAGMLPEHVWSDKSKEELQQFLSEVFNWKK